MQKSLFWKLSRNFCESPNVSQLAAVLDVPLYTAGALIALLYGWAVGHADDDGNINDYTEQALERACMWDGERGALMTAFYRAEIIVGDMEGRPEEDPLRINGWTELASDILRERRSSRERQQLYRDRQKNSGNVTRGVTRYASCDVTPPENKDGRVENIEDELSAAKRSNAPSRFSVPEVDEVAAFMERRATEKRLRIGARMEAERFVDYYNANGWKVGRNKMRDWRAAARNWLARKSPQTGKAEAFQLTRQSDVDVNDLSSLYR